MGFGRGFCATATFAVISGLWLDFWDSTRSISADLIESPPYIILTTTVATLGWALLHLRCHQPGPGSYIALAIAIVIIVHSVLMYSDSAHPGTYLMAVSFGFVFHFWFTLPIAVGATGLFVWCLKHWKVAC